VGVVVVGGGLRNCEEACARAYVLLMLALAAMGQALCPVSGYEQRAPKAEG
jgi:hypothetical protein